MEFLEGQTLAKRLRRGALPLNQVLRFAIEIADALENAHRAGITHRDLKPANIMLTESGAKLLDFGLAKLRVAEATSGASKLSTVGQRPDDLTNAGAILGTWQYMSPEQLEGRVVDSRSDVFAFGAVIHEMATGCKPFQGASHASVIAAILDSDPPPVSAYAPNAPPALDRLVGKCLAKDPNHRWQTSRDLLDELKWIAHQNDGREVRVRRRMPVWWSGLGRFRRRAAIVSVLAAVVAGLAAWAWIYRPHRPLEAAGHRLVTDYDGAWGFSSFSPDGSMFAYSGSGPGAIDQVWIKNVASGDPIQLTFGESRATRLAWAPTGDQIVFSRAGQGLWSVPPLGGAPRRLIEQGNRPKFSADGRRLVFQRGNEIWMANADGSAARRVIEMSSFAGGNPALSPDGQWIVFFQTPSGPRGDYWVAPATGGAARRLTFDETLGGAPVWTPDGRSIVFPSARAGSVTLWQVPATGGSPRPLTVGAGDDIDPDISADGRKLMYTNVRGSHGLVLRDPITGQDTELIERRTSIFGPMFSPSGDRIAFFQQVETDVHLFTVGVDGKGLEQITRTAGETNVFPRWSADGMFIDFFQIKPAVSFRRLAVAGGEPREIGPWSSESGAALDPAGQRVVYRQQVGEPITATVVHELATKRETPLPVLIWGARWSRDGRAIIGTEDRRSADGGVHQNVVECAIDAACRVLTHGHRAVLSGDDSRVFFLRSVAGQSTDRELWSVDRDGKSEQLLGRLGPFVVTEVHFDVSPRNQVVWVRVQTNAHKLWLADLK